MARRRKQTPELSTITRNHTVAYARKQKPGGGDEDDGGATDEEVKKAALATMKSPQTDKPAEPSDRPTVPFDKPEPSDRPTMPFDPRVLDEVRKDAVPEEPGRRPHETVGVPISGFGGFGTPPEIPTPSSPSIVIKGGIVEDPTHMPGPRDIPPGSPDDVASPPGYVPAGDSRSLRRREATYEFALIYRMGNAVISRVGAVGTRGVWRVVEYPTTASASHAYAKEASRFVSEGFSDYRE